jgi:hypothetical protein
VRKYVAVPLGLLVAVLCFGAVANAAGIITPTKVSASVSPRHVNGPPYTFVTSGTIRFNPIYCPPGTTNPAYCTVITAKEACTGKISLKVGLGRDPLLADAKKTIDSTGGKVSSKCTYSIKTKLRKSDFTATTAFRPHQFGAHVFVHFKVKFQGNSVLNAKTARTQYVVAKVLQP